MIDSHTHIFCEHFDGDLAEVIDRANGVGVGSMVLPGIDSKSHQTLFDVCDKYSCCYPAIGLHPTSVGEDFEMELQQVESYYDRYKQSIVAIGEVGIDLYWSSDFIVQQREAFAYQVEMAIKYSLPLIIHTRSAYDEMFDILIKYKSRGIRGVFHSFDQDEDIYKKMSIFDGFYFGIGGVVTFKKSIISQSVKVIPLERILLETDAPYLTPSPYRGKRNEPSYLEYIAHGVAEAKGIDVEIVRDVTMQNAKKLFKI